MEDETGRVNVPADRKEAQDSAEKGAEVNPLLSEPNGAGGKEKPVEPVGLGCYHFWCVWMG